LELNRVSVLVGLALFDAAAGVLLISRASRPEERRRSGNLVVGAALLVGTLGRVDARRDRAC